ncbi:MAG: hypothetical protein HY960_04050 [Ignavibacteriae bacterium]|nr:hypothetical protein [Ignavibacteriota bacterium]
MLLKNLILFFCFLGISPSFSFSQNPYSWRTLPKPTIQTLSSVFFIDSVTGWVAGKEGVVFKTTNSGTSWLQQTSGTTSEIVEIFMLNHMRGWMLAPKYATQPGEWYGTFYLQTTNGGTTWSLTEYPEIFLYSIAFNDSLNGLVGGEQGLLLRTDDGGETWKVTDIESTLVSYRPLRKIRYYSDDFVMAVGGQAEFAGPIWRSTNGGQSWRVFLTADKLDDFQFIDSLNIVAVGGGLDDGAAAARSTDGGWTWNFQYIGMFGTAKAIAFRTPSEAFTPLTNTGTFIYTGDSGISWTEKFTPDSSYVNDVFFTDERHGYMVGKNGSVFKYNHPRSFQVNQQWNIISIPVLRTISLKDSLFPTASSSVFIFSPTGYEIRDTLTNGTGYWLKFPTAQTIQLEGYPIQSDTIAILEGWNMVGSITEPVSVSAITSQPAELTLSQFFGYSSGYSVADTIQPGKGYWVKSNVAGNIILNTESVLVK